VATAKRARFFDLLGYENQLLADPASFGLPALDDIHPCQSGGPAAVIGGCTGYLYFDRGNADQLARVGKKSARQ
jgi:hypothetical protein